MTPNRAPSYKNVREECSLFLNKKGLDDQRRDLCFAFIELHKKKDQTSYTPSP